MKRTVILIVIRWLVYGECPEGFTDVSPGTTVKYGNCIKVLAPNNWVKSESLCERIYGGNLAYPSNEHENEAIAKMAPMEVIRFKLVDENNQEIVKQLPMRHKQMWIGYN